MNSRADALFDRSLSRGKIKEVRFEEDEIAESEAVSLLCGERSALTEFLETGILKRTKPGRIKFTFVGVIVADTKVIYVHPKYCKGSSKDISVQDDFYLKVIRLYLKRKSRLGVNGRLDDVSFLMKTFLALNDFYKKYGIFKERHKSHSRKSAGPVNWSRTMTECAPIHLRTGVLYEEPIHHAIRSHEGAVSHVFKTVLTLLATFISPILDAPHPLCRRGAVDKFSVEVTETIDKKREMYAHIIAKAISHESGERRRVLAVLLAFLRYDQVSLGSILRAKHFAFGTTNFENIWEDACVVAVGGERGSKGLTQPVWIPADEVRKTVKYRQRIDAKIADNGDDKFTHIVDAKYYYDEKGEERIPLPDVIKQFGYAYAYASNGDNKVSLDNIICSFLIPGQNKNDGTEIKFDGRIIFAGPEGNSEKARFRFNPIMVFKVAPIHVFQHYLQRKSSKTVVEYVKRDHVVQKWKGSIDGHTIRVVKREGRWFIQPKSTIGADIAHNLRETYARLKAAHASTGISSLIDQIRQCAAKAQRQVKIGEVRGGTFEFLREVPVPSLELADVILRAGHGDLSKARTLDEMKEQWVKELL